MKLRIARMVVAFLSLSFSLAPLTLAQTSAQTASALPRLVRFGGTVKDLNGSALTGVVGITFALYSEQTRGAPLWLETQNATADSNGHYTVLLGSTKPEGLPAELFTSEQARWVGVQVSGQAEQARVLLVSAPYALKAGDAETIGGLPPSAFVLAASAIIGSSTSSSTAETVSPLSVTDVTTTGGTLNYLPIFSGAATIIDSSVFQTGTGTTGKIGIDTITPATQLDVNGAGTIRGTLSLPPTGTATAAGGKDSQGLNLVASSFSSTSGTAQGQVFRWQAEPAANDTTAPSGTLNLLYGLGTATPTETGLHIARNGRITFATGQTFPGTGAGTITGVTAGTDLTGGGTTGTVTLNLNTAEVPLLTAANVFTGNQTVNGNLSATGVVSGSSFEIGSNLFAFGSYTSANAFFGFAGNSTTTGIFDTASGYQAFISNTTGYQNTAIGAYALYSNTTGYQNTATGHQALAYNTLGTWNTATGYQALAYNTGDNLGQGNGTANTADGYQALYSNTLGQQNVANGYQALYSNTGQNTGQDGGNANTANGYQALYSNTLGELNVANGYQALYSNTSGFTNTATGAQALYSNTGGDSGAAQNTADGYQALQYNTQGFNNTATGAFALQGNGMGYNNTAVGELALANNGTGFDLTCIGAECDDSGDGLNNATAIGAHARVGASNSFVLGGTGKYAVKVGIGTEIPSNVLTIARSAGHPVADGWDTFSSRRWKTNIQPLQDALGKVEQLRGVSYDLKDSGKHEIGVIAEEDGSSSAGGGQF
jgi:hypothetical protein